MFPSKLNHLKILRIREIKPKNYDNIFERIRNLGFLSKNVYHQNTRNRTKPFLSQEDRIDDREITGLRSAISGGKLGEI